MRIGIVAAEPSGDRLGAGLMEALRDCLPDVRFEGIGGPGMLSLGLDGWEPLESLSVMGLVEVLADLPRLLALRRRIMQRWIANPPDLYIGIDAPDFNLGIERRLRDRGVPTVHYVCPTVWAWRAGRTRDIRRSVDLLLSIFPFESAFLARHGIEATYVGHPLAREMPMQPDREGARRALGIGSSEPVLAVLPGSRGGEVARLSEPFLMAARAMQARVPGLRIVTPLANDGTRDLFEEARRRLVPDLEVRMETGATRQFLAACDLALVASGTATLEGLLAKRPMVVGYKLNPLTFPLLGMTNLRRMPHYAMANILDGEGLAPEFIQQQCRPENLVHALMALFEDPGRVARIKQAYHDIHASMTLDTNVEAARAVCALLAARGPRQGASDGRP